MFDEKLFGNHEIWVHIYNMLDFIDQLRLCRVNEQLRSIFQYYIWKENYQHLIVKGNSNPSDFVISNESSINRLCLDEEELQEFLNTYSDKVKVLSENRGGVLDLKKFPRLTGLTYLDLRLSYKQLKLISECCPCLEKLYLSCLTEDECEFIEIGRNWSIKKVLKLRRLKSLRMDHEDYVPIKYRHFRQIVTKLPLECLQLKASIEPDITVIKADNKYCRNIQLKDLNVAASFEANKWSQNISWFLTNFENLQSLTVKITHTITEDTLAIIAKTCKSLETLKIHYSSFGQIKEFPLPPKVGDLSLHHCRGINSNVLQKILNVHQKLQRFSCRDSDFEATTEHISVNTCIQALDLDCVDTVNILNAAAHNQLQELVWYHNSPLKDSRDILSPKSLTQCTNLQVLDVKVGQIEVAIMQQLNILSKLIIAHPKPLLNWNYIVDILKHPTLTELIIRDSNTTRSSKHLCPVIPTIGFPINMSKLQIPLDLFDAALEFWLNLFEKNPNIKLICCKFCPHDMNFLKKLINHSQFPKCLKTIDVCCFSISRSYSISIKVLSKIIH